MATLLVNDLNPRVQYTATSSQTVFAYGFSIFNDSDLKVYVGSTVKTLTTDYTVSGAGTTAGGNVTFGTGLTSGDIVTIYRDLPVSRTTDYQANGDLLAESLNDDLDKLAMMIQQVEYDLNSRTLRFGQFTTGIPLSEFTENATDRAGKVLAFDSSGDPNITQELGTYQGTDATTTTAAYSIRDIVKSTTTAQLNNIYICTATSPSGTALTNTSYWALIIDAVAAGSSATAAASSASAAATSETNAATSATNAATSETNAATSATSASTAKTNAETAETNAETAETNAEAAVGAVAWKYTFDSSTTMADPGTGDIRLDNATVASVTNLAFDAVSADTGNPDISDFIASIDDGTNDTHEGFITIRKSGTPATFAVFSVTGTITDNTGWLQVPVTHVASNGTLSGSLYVSFTRSGGLGATGSTGATGPTGATGATGATGGGLADVVDDTTPQLGGDLDCNGAQIQWSKGADVASATALPVLTDGNYFDVTGTTTVTSINTTGGAGTLIKLHFDAILILTHHATDLILPGGANITTAAGDEAEFIEYATGDYRCTNYSKADGTSVVAASGGATDIDGLSDGTTSGTNNVGLGSAALDSLTSGSRNTGLGDNTGTAITSGYDNVSIGHNAGAGITTMFGNVAIGSRALDVATTYRTTAIGYNCMTSLTTAEYNVGVGYDVLQAETTGQHNVGMGYRACATQVAQHYNTGIGYTALQWNTAGANTGVGTGALFSNTSGANETAIGAWAGYYNTTGTENAFIGESCNGTSATASNEFTLGGSAVSNLRCNDTSISSLSDERDKTNITDLPDTAGLELINKLRPVTFNWDRREWYSDNTSDSSKMNTTF